MPLDPQARRLLSMLAATGAAKGGYETADERRRSLETLIAMAGGEGPALFAVEDLAAGNIPLRLYRPAAGALPALVFLHGGGWVAGDLETHDGLCRRIAAASGCVVVAVAYRLAPEHQFPAALDDGLQALRFCRERAGALGIDPMRMAVAGDSAGGALAAAICAVARDAGGPGIALQLLLCPILDLSRRSASRLRLANGYFIDEATVALDAALYLGGDRDPADARVSPLLATDFTGLPTAIIVAAEYDPFADEARAYAEKLGDAGVAVRLSEAPGMIHFFYALPGALPHAEAVVREVARAAGDALRGA